MTSAAIDAHHGHAEHEGGAVGDFVSTYVFSKDHKIIGLQFLFSTLLWFLVGGHAGARAFVGSWRGPWTNMPDHWADAVLR